MKVFLIVMFIGHSLSHVDKQATALGTRPSRVALIIAAPNALPQMVALMTP